MRFCFDKKELVEKEIDANKLAVIGSDFNLTWSKFNTQVQQTVDVFKKFNLHKSANSVIVYGHKSANMMVAFYALMKLEVPYIPIDIIYPTDRINKVIEISGCEVIINTHTDGLNCPGTSEIILKEDNITVPESIRFQQTDQSVTDPLIYTIFTSGSTGEPKGVQITTEAVRSFTRWMTSDFGFTNNEIFINSAILSFDLSVFEVMTFAAIGGTILLNDKGHTADPALMIKRIQQYQGTTWVSTPSYAILYARMDTTDDLSSIQNFLFCGEILPHALAKTLKAKFKNAKVWNTYGPTEATVATTLVEITEDTLAKYDPLPVGTSKKESELLIENGEIIIVGPNVSIGYLNQPKLNAEKFITINNQRAFKTGDQGKIMDDMLFFAGRNDDLVKLHGYRIELNEISSVMNNLPYIIQAETIALKRNDVVKKIVSLVQLKNDSQRTAQEIKADIAASLPPYMIPADIKIIDAIPLNQNGKADKKLLKALYMKK